MVGMRMDHGQIEEHLLETQTIYSQKALECAGIIFGTTGTIEQKWKIKEQLQFEYDYLVTMGSGSDTFRAISCIGVNSLALNHFMGEEVSREYAADVLGEFINSYCGLLTDCDAFKDIFGVHLQAIPCMHTDGCAYLPFMWGIQGDVIIDGEALSVAFSICKK